MPCHTTHYSVSNNFRHSLNYIRPVCDADGGTQVWDCGLSVTVKVVKILQDARSFGGNIFLVTWKRYRIPGTLMRTTDCGNGSAVCSFDQSEWWANGLNVGFAKLGSEDSICPQAFHHVKVYQSRTRFLRLTTRETVPAFITTRLSASRMPM